MDVAVIQIVLKRTLDRNLPLTAFLGQFGGILNDVAGRGGARNEE